MAITLTQDGYDSKSGGFIYVLTDDALTKVGITNKSAEIRCKHVSAQSNRSFRVVKAYWVKDGTIPRAIEKNILAQLTDKYRKPVDKFPGSTECFFDVNCAALLNKIESLIQEYTDAHQASQEA